MAPARIAVFFSATTLGYILKIKATANCKQKLMLNQKIIVAIKVWKKFQYQEKRKF